MSRGGKKKRASATWILFQLDKGPPQRLIDVSIYLHLSCHEWGACDTWQEEEEGIGDVDLFQLDKGTPQRLAVHSKWLGHLAERQLGDDGHPRKVSQSSLLTIPGCLQID